MAIRDRATVRLKDGTERSFTVTRQGGKIDVNRNKGWMQIEEQNKAGEAIRTMQFPESELAMYILDNEPAVKVKRARKRATEEG